MKKILTSYKNHSDEINRIFAGPPFAINDVKDAGINHKIKLYLEYVRKPWSETNIRGKDYFEADLRIINEFQDYNKKFLNGKLYGQDDLPYKQSVTRNPYKTSEERKAHIKIRHTPYFLDGEQFIRLYKYKYLGEPFSQFYKEKDKEPYKGNCFKVISDTQVDTLFRDIESTANMSDIYDFWSKENLGNQSIHTIAGSRTNKILVAIKDEQIDTAFPNSVNYKEPYFWGDNYLRNVLYRPIKDDAMINIFNKSIDWARNNSTPATHKDYDILFDQMWNRFNIAGKNRSKPPLLVTITNKNPTIKPIKGIFKALTNSSYHITKEP